MPLLRAVPRYTREPKGAQVGATSPSRIPLFLDIRLAVSARSIACCGGMRCADLRVTDPDRDAAECDRTQRAMWRESLWPRVSAVKPLRYAILTMRPRPRPGTSRTKSPPFGHDRRIWGPIEPGG